MPNQTKHVPTLSKDILKPKEMHFARLRAAGMSVVKAYQVSHNKTKLEPRNCSEQAYRLARKPHIDTFVMELFNECKKSQILSHGRWLDMMLSSFDKAISEGNLTAAASFGRLLGGGIGSLSEQLNINDERMSPEQLIDKLAASQPELADRIRKVVGGRDTFH